jgi:hypothetical protein
MNVCHISSILPICGVMAQSKPSGAADVLR